VWSKVNWWVAFPLKSTCGMVSVPELIIPALSTESYLLTCSPFRWPYHVAILVFHCRCFGLTCGRFGRKTVTQFSHCFDSSCWLFQTDFSSTWRNQVVNVSRREASVIIHESDRTTWRIREAIRIWQEIQGTTNRDEGTAYQLSLIYDNLLVSMVTSHRQWKWDIVQNTSMRMTR